MELERSWWNIFSADEIMVAETLATLLPLPLPETKSSKCFGLFSFTWGRKKRRSAIFVPVSWPRQHHTDPSPPPPPPKAEEASSPATPLSFFPPSESDDKDNSTPLPSNSTLKRKREHYLKTVQDLKIDNELLAGEIKNVQCYYDRIKHFNLKLKARKRELSGGPNQRATSNPSREIRERQTTSSGVVSSSGSGNGSALGNRNNSNNMGTGPSPSATGIPDLNLPFEVEVEEEESMAVVGCCEEMDNKDMNRASAAQARQNRYQICKLKNSRYSHSRR